jgi:hypothetical protein
VNAVNAYTPNILLNSNRGIYINNGRGNLVFAR